MGDDKAGSVLHQGAHRLLNLLLGAGVDVGGRLVENQHLGVGEHGARDGQHLLLSLRDVQSVVADDGVVAVRQAHDEVMNLGCLGRGDDLLAGRARAAEGDVVIDGAIEQPGVLQHHRVGRAQAPAGDVHAVAPLHQDVTLLRVVKAHQQVDDGGLARAGRADDGHQTAGPGVQVEVVNDDLFRVISKLDALHLHVALDVGKGGCLRQIGRLGLLVDQAEDTLGRRSRRLQFADDVGHLVDRAGEPAGIQHEGREVAQRDAAHQIQKRAENAD